MCAVPTQTHVGGGKPDDGSIWQIVSHSHSSLLSDCPAGHVCTPQTHWQARGSQVWLPGQARGAQTHMHVSSSQTWPDGQSCFISHSHMQVMRFSVFPAGHTIVSSHLTVYVADPVPIPRFEVD